MRWYEKDLDQKMEVKEEGRQVEEVGIELLNADIQVLKGRGDEMAIKKTTKDIVGSSMMLGVGGLALGAMRQGAIIPKTIGRGATMMGAVIPAAYGMDILNMVDKKSKKLRGK